MKAILIKEIKSFFGSLIGYLVIGIFLVLCGLFLWIFDGDYNILQSRYNDLMPFFQFAPWVLLLLVPAVTMRSFAEEKKQGTMELLLTKPVSVLDIVLGKYFGAALLIIIAILPTLLYILVLQPYGFPANNMDIGSAFGSYIGLVFLILAYTAIGIFASTLTDNQIVAFLVAVAGCLLFYIGFEKLSELMGNQTLFIEKIGMNYHYKSISRGVIDTRDLVYFATLSVAFVAITHFQIKSLRK